jgi:hypothetical protein
MDLTGREWWGLLHGGLGVLFLLAFAGGLAGLHSLRPALITPAGAVEGMRRLKAGVVGMAAVAWVTVITGTWVVFPWYRDKAPTSAKSRLLADPATQDWHEFAMEWKEHVAWLSPILATVVAFVVVYYGTTLIRHQRARRAVMALFVLAFVFAGVSGAFGALITKSAAVR